jgi:cation transport ATPase
MNVATLNQAQASDQWAFFEAQSIKENFYQIESEHLSADPATDPAVLARIQAKVDKYEKTKAETTEKAKQFEANRDAARKTADSAAEHSRQMGLSVTLFQIAIALGAMCLIVKKKPLWFAAMILGALASAQMLYVLYFLPM